MNKRGKASKIAIIILISLLGVAGWLIYTTPDFSDEIEAIQNFLQFVSLVAFGGSAVYFLIKTKFLGLLK